MSLTLPFERSMVMNKTIAFVSGVFVVIVILISFGLSFVSPLRFVEPVYNNSAVTQELQNELQLENRYFLLTSVFVMQQEIESLDYIQGVSIERQWPNTLRLQISANVPVACSENTLYYVGLDIVKTSTNEQLCRNIPVVTAEGLSEALRVELRSLDLLLLQQLTSITEASDSITVMINDLEVTMYVEQLPKLTSILNQEISSNNIDIRANYA